MNFTPMNKMRRRGVASIEYGTLASLIAVAVIVSLTSFGVDLKTNFCSISNSLTSVSARVKSSSLIDTANDSCENGNWLSKTGISSVNEPLSDVLKACNGSSGCVAHFEQVKYSGNRSAFLASLGIDSDNLVQTTDSSDVKSEKDNAASNLAQQACSAQYPSDSAVASACQSAVVTAIQMYDPSTYAWDPTQSP